jgi:acylphosphatase
MNAFRLIVSGVVQGVGFRAYVAAQARKLQLQGTVKNLEDGTVEILVSGNENQIREFKNECLHAPAPIKVADIIETVLKNPPELSGFGVIY